MGWNYLDPDHGEVMLFLSNIPSSAASSGVSYLIN